MSSFTASQTRRARGLWLSTATTLTIGAALLTPSATRAAEPAVCSSTNPADWPAPSKPYFMIIVDTSGSMDSGVGTTDSCGYGTDRNAHARCAVTNTVQAFAGQANFGLASYAWRYTGCNDGLGRCPGSGSRTGRGCGAEYTASDNGFCGPLGRDPGVGGSGNNIHFGAYINVPLLQDHYWSQPPAASNVPEILSWVDNNCTGSKELGKASNTPLGGSLYNMNQYYSGTYVDPFTGDTLASPIRTNGVERLCRALNVILITDGNEVNCDESVSPSPIAGGCRSGNGSYLNNAGERLASYEADKLWTQGVTVNGMNFKVKTHVIGFAGASQTAMDHIATCGGSGSSYSTANEGQLASALAAIIGGAIQPETCDNADNNCNGCTDEGYKHYCNENRAPSANPTQLGQCCSAARATCLTNFKSSITPANPQGNRWWLPCWTPTAADTNPEQKWLCANPGEVCDDQDNNCDKTIDPSALGTNTADEGFNKCGSPLHCPQAETCDGADQDCDLIIDNSAGSAIPYSACPNNCQPTAEICDGCDNDCDGVIDNGIAPIACGFSPPASCAGTQTCAVKNPSGGTYVDGSGHLCVAGGGTWGACAGQTTSPEDCDGVDDDCDGIVDDGVPDRACDVPSGTGGFPGPYQYGGKSQCQRGVEQCVSGTFGACAGWVGPSAEICDGIDNDCDGSVDENIPGLGLPCGSDTGTCTKGQTACDSALGQIVCQGGNPPQPETCNGNDDDCNGVTDDNLADAPAAGSGGCWKEPGNCCAHQGYAWCPPTGATCSGLGSLTTPCATGNLMCNGVGGWTCSNPKGPTGEVCDGVDNNCNGPVDESLGSPVGDACGADIGECKKGTNACDGGVIVCQGGQGPTAEVCNGKDDDCDGQVDNGVGLGGACTASYDTASYPGDRSQGQCKPGALACDPNGTGNTICNGGVGPQPELCDGLDNDCDGLVDEPGPAPDGISGSENPSDPTQHIGDDCGVSVGECKAGKLACTNGQVICSGSVGPRPETCDCRDNDCDGRVDEDAAPGEGAPVCGGGKTCVEVHDGLCQCASPCQTAEFPCPQSGTTCQTVDRSGTDESAGKFCVNDPCGNCQQKTHKDSKGTVVCGPAGTLAEDGSALPECVCTPSGCDHPCAEITCSPGQDCVMAGPSAGTCHSDTNCFFFPCSTGEVCNAKTCIDDPCDPSPCQPDEVCKPSSDFSTARCVGSCASVTCSTGEECVEGTCRATGCAQGCPDGEYCLDDGSGGFACQPSKCDADGGASCTDGYACDPKTGSCGNPPCAGVTCPAAQVCENGQCVWAPEGGTGGAGGAGATGGTGGAGATDGGSSGGSGGTRPDSGLGGAAGGTSNGGASAQGAWGLATGGGGCACRAAGAGHRLPGPGAVLVGLGLTLGLIERRRRKQVSLRGARVGGGRS
ncbi:MAG: MopE-related protein [Sorangiineae bacterium]|nr:MopE-related protein [Polyangiaceae bacterium]MEB2320932.1 MopE-related protein [Sorangiineae bacterium]